MSSVVKPLACRAGRREFDSWNRTNTQGLKTTVEEDTVLPLPCKRLDLRVARKTTQKWRSRLHVRNCYLRTKDTNT